MKHSIFYSFAFICILAISMFFIVPKEASGAQDRQVTGTVTGIDIKNSTITVMKKNATVTLDINKKTTLTQCTNSPTLSDIRIGDKVTVKYRENPGENSARSVTIRASGKESE